MRLRAGDVHAKQSRENIPSDALCDVAASRADLHDGVVVCSVDGVAVVVGIV